MRSMDLLEILNVNCLTVVVRGLQTASHMTGN